MRQTFFCRSASKIKMSVRNIYKEYDFNHPNNSHSPSGGWAVAWFKKNVIAQLYLLLSRFTLASDFKCNRCIAFEDNKANVAIDLTILILIIQYSWIEI